LENPLDNRGESGEKIPCYSSISKEKSTEYNWLFDNLPVEPLTIKQNTPEWFLLRAFSCTSSTLDQLINELKIAYLDLNATGLIDETTEAALKRVLDFIQGSRWKASQHAHIEMTHPSPQRDNIIDDEPVDD